MATGASSLLRRTGVFKNTVLKLNRSTFFHLHTRGRIRLLPPASSRLVRVLKCKKKKTTQCDFVSAGGRFYLVQIGFA